MKKSFYKFGPSGFSLAELMAALTIGAMVLVAVLSIYNRVERSAAAISQRLEGGRLPAEVLQLISEDLDGIVVSGESTSVEIENKFDNLFPTARMEILKTIYDAKDQPQVFEKIVWQANYDYESEAGGLALYRSYSGIRLEDKLLDSQKEDWERELFVPVCTGLTFFKIQIPRGEELLERWVGNALPGGVMVTLSFSEPFKAISGTFDVAEEEKYSRTIAIDRTRKIRFAVIKQQSEEPSEEESEEAEEQVEDANDIQDSNST
jgi:prepilin-type N-terminal cleavage/methylation domain-containing protein